ncbi:MAG: glycosyltransferase family 4 protein [Lachnospiraceae bacterium]|nr:glycosyltransferase family 4 protein [Lachnospiraceae bacterium]GFI01204.1 GalNAc-alpha-(1->4)-GalNAc-alpha-(1->3)-diNAcBac-PP-undecaprenol alpha-1,4-N-acetyl-D-galactosaminyltransferase [Lachnospiraceae bacterium]
MKILFTVASMAGGGAERVISILASHLMKDGHQVMIVMTAGERVDYQLDPKIQVISIGGTSGGKLGKRLKRIQKLRALFCQNKDGVIVSFGLGSNFYTAIAHLGLKNRLVISERNDPAACPHPYFRNKVFGCADRLVFQTKDALECFPKRLREKGCVIPNPISGTIIPPYEGARKKTIVAVGRLEPQKNYPLLLKAFAVFHKKYPAYTLHIYGRGELLTGLENLSRELGIARAVRFEGYAPDVHEKIKDAGMYVLPSDYEGISNALLEAMALGLPAVATDCPIGGSKLCITHEENGLLVPVGDAEKMEEAMSRLASCEELADRLGKEAVKVRQRFSEETVMAEWNKVLS